MRLHAMLFVAALIMPAFVGAQRAGVGTTDPLRPLEQADMGPPQMPEARQMEKGTPAAVLLDKKKKLALTDSQMAFLTALRKATADSNARNYVVWDSVRSDLLIAGRSPSVDPADVQRWRRSVQQLYQGLQARNAWARTEATKVLTESQLPKAKEYWADEEEQDQKWLRPRGRSGGGGGGRRPPGS